MENDRFNALVEKVVSKFNNKTRQAWELGKCDDDLDALRTGLNVLIISLCANVPKRKRNAEDIYSILKESSFYRNNAEFIDILAPLERIEDELERVKASENALVSPSKKDLLLNYLDNLEIKIANNLISHREYITVGDDKPRLLEDQDITDIWNGFTAHEPKVSLSWNNVRNLILSIARDNAYNPVKQLFDELPSWDKKTRIEELVSKLTGGEYSQADVEIVKCFGIQAYELGTSEEPKGADYILVLQGKSEGTGKTHFTRLFYLSDYCKAKYGFKSFNEVRAFNPSNTDDKMIATSYFGVELSEFGESAKYSEALKSFITDDTDTYRRPYGSLPVTYQRRTTYIATVNSEEFLTADAHNRRYLVIPVKSERFITEFADFDFLQMWAEIKVIAEERKQTLMQEGHNMNVVKTYSLPEDFQTQIVNRNKRFSNKVPGELELADYLTVVREYPGRYEYKWMTLNQFKDPIYDDIYRTFSKFSNHQLGIACNVLGIERKRKSTGAIYKLPYPKVQQGRYDFEQISVEPDEDNKIKVIK